MSVDSIALCIRIVFIILGPCNSPICKRKLIYINFSNFFEILFYVLKEEYVKDGISNLFDNFFGSIGQLDCFSNNADNESHIFLFDVWLSFL